MLALEMAKLIHENNVSKGFWPDNVLDRNFGEAIALIHSEIAELQEALRQPAPCEKAPTISNVEEELADIKIRGLDLIYAYDPEALKDYDTAALVYALMFAATNGSTKVSDILLMLHEGLSLILESHRTDPDPKLTASNLVLFLHVIEGFSLSLGVDIGVAVLTKHEVNLKRAHKHGKGY